MSHTDNSAARYNVLLAAKREGKLILLWANGDVESVNAPNENGAPPVYSKARARENYSMATPIDPSSDVTWERIDFYPTTLVDSGGRLVYLEKARG